MGRLRILVSSGSGSGSGNSNSNSNSKGSCCYRDGNGNGNSDSDSNYCDIRDCIVKVVLVSSYCRECKGHENGGNGSSNSIRNNIVMVLVMVVCSCSDVSVKRFSLVNFIGKDIMTDALWLIYVTN